MTIRHLFLFFVLTLSIAGCSGSTTPPPTAPSPPPAPAPTPPVADVTISGKITFDLVPAASSNIGLNYDATRQAPARGIAVEAVDASNNVLASTRTDAAGDYRLIVRGDTNMRIRARAEMAEAAIGDWNVTVRDNTNGNAIYVLDGSLANSGTANSTRNLNAPSGWGGTSYTGTRAAAPFAMLDVIYEANDLIRRASAGPTLPRVQIFWSTRNRSGGSDIANGEIGTSSYAHIGGVPTILILGNADTDTDEYDRSIIAHEYGHYVEDQLARNDSIGGSHSLSDRLDPRLAMSEGWGNAFASMVLDDPVYRDSLGARQASGFSFNVETGAFTNAGWFNEGSVQSILYDLFDSTNDSADRDQITLGFAPIYATLRQADYINANAPTSIFAFLNALRNNTSVSDSELDALIAAQSISGTGVFGEGETNNGGIVSTLPIFKTLTVGAAPVEVCSVDDAGTPNKLGNRAFLRFSPAAAGVYTFTMTRSSGLTGRDPDFILYQQGNPVFSATRGHADTETAMESLNAGDFWIEAYDATNIITNGATGDVCFDFSVSQ